jgi:hypothetical protein
LPSSCATGRGHPPDQNTISRTYGLTLPLFSTTIAREPGHAARRQADGVSQSRVQDVEPSPNSALESDPGDVGEMRKALTDLRVEVARIGLRAFLSVERPARRGKGERRLQRCQEPYAGPASAFFPGERVPDVDRRQGSTWAGWVLR